MKTNVMENVIWNAEYFVLPSFLKDEMQSGCIVIKNKTIFHGER